MTSLFLVNSSLAQEIEWAVAAQGVNGELGTAVSADDNYIYHGGDLSGEAVFAPGELNEEIVDGHNYVARYTHDGGLDWVAAIPSTVGSLDINGIESDPWGNVYITGEVFTGDVHTFGLGEPNETTIDSGFNASDIFVAKFNKDGSFAWARTAGINEQNGARDIAVDHKGASYITGYFRSNIVIGAEGTTPSVELTSQGGVLDNDVFIVKFDTDGDLIWARSAGGADGADTGFGISLDHKNNIFVAGGYRTQAIFGANTKREVVIDAYGLSDGFLARFSPDGIPIWVVTIGGDSWDQGQDLVTQKGKAVIVGSFNETATFGSTDGATQQLTAQSTDNIFIARYNRAGELQWTNGIYMDDTFDFSIDAGIGEDQQSCVMANFSGMATFGSGQTNETVLNSPGDADMYFACYSGQGVFQWVEPDPAPLKSSTMTSKGEIIVTGGYQGNTFFGPLDPNDELLLNAGSRDIYLAKYQSQKPGFSFTDIDDIKAGASETQMDAFAGTAGIPDTYELNGNYPNPFNPQTTIRFGLPESAQVSLQVFDVTGRVVANLVDGSLQAGSHEIQFGASDLPSGLYLYKLSTPAGQFTKVMSLIK
ncbi:MAG: T9SS type A sorting domain-containing protein [Rhodothermales bacterium]